MTDILGNELFGGEIVIIGSRSRAKLFRVGIVLKTNVQWGPRKEERVLVRCLDTNYLPLKKAVLTNPKYIRPDKLLRVSSYSFDLFITTALVGAFREYKKELKAAKRDKETREKIRNEIRDI